MRPVNNLLNLNLSAGVSSAAWTYDTVRASFQTTVSSGTAVSGTLAIQVSNDQATGKFPNQYQPTNWNTLTASSVSTGSTVLIPATELAYEYVRASFTVSSGSLAGGVLSIRMKALNL